VTLAENLAEELRATFLTGGLTDEQLAELIAVGTTVAFEPDDELFREGEPADYLWILLEGSIGLYRQAISETSHLMTMTTPGQWAGGLRAWGDASAASGYRASGAAVSAGRVFRVPSEDLGRLVEEWFPFGKHMINGVYQTIRNIDAMARQRESLVALGTLAAGLAHEINNPAAAALRAVEGLRETCDAMMSSLQQLAERSISAEQFIELDRLRRELSAPTVADDGALARMDREDAVGGWLSDHHVANPWTIAPLLASAGADREWLDAFATAAGPDALGEALRWTSSTINANALLGELADSTKRVSNLVGAVRSYSQLDRAELHPIDVDEGLDSTLAMLAPKLGRVTVERAFADDIGPIEAYGAELNQVWTNLIDNAVDAMDGTGTLRLATRRDGDVLVVEVTDSGSGMGADVQARIFEPFFTTKDVGKGTGLGLDISRRIIVDRHHGDITFDSRPGATTAIVRIPVTQTNRS